MVDVNHLVGKGFFSMWNDVAEFEKVEIDCDDHFYYNFDIQWVISIQKILHGQFYIFVIITWSFLHFSPSLI